MNRRHFLMAAAAVARAAETTVMISPGDSFEAALAKGAKTLVLSPGIYRGIRVRTAGVTIRAATKWKAVVLGSEEHGVSIEAPGVVIDGLEVAGSRVDGVKASADGATVRNCWVHNNAAQGIAIHGRKRWTIERNLIEFNGQHPQLQHGVYADGEDGVVNANVVRHNSGYGLQLYPAMRGVAVVNNVIHGHGKKGAIVLAAPGGRNVVANNTLVENAYGVRLMEGSGQVIANNIIVGPDPVSGEPVLRSNLLEDPQFIDRTREIYFLAPGSPAIGKASAEYAPATDFWGGERPRDIGALPFVASFADPKSRAAWHNGWPYRFSATDPRMEMPDLWVDSR